MGYGERRLRAPRPVGCEPRSRQRGAALGGGPATIAASVTARTVGATLLALAGAGLLYRAAGRGRPLAALGFHTEDGKGGAGLSARAAEIQRSLTIQAPRDDVYRRWRHPENQRLVWSHFAEIGNASDEGASWRVRGPLGRALEWETRIVEERDGHMLRWESTSGDVPNAGVAEFGDAPAGLGTEITLRVRFDPPGGPLGAVAARVLDDPPTLVLAKALRRFKSLVETGEIPSTERNPSARGS